VYNFRDEPSPSLLSTVDTASGIATLIQGSEQGDFLSESFTGGSVSVSIQPPTGWSLQSVNWSNGTPGVLSVPPPGVEESHRFDFTLAQNGTSLTGTGKFKIKKATGGSSGG
jgi:hypothetical protein